MGNGGILWIWMTIIISVVHLNPLIVDFDHPKENPPDYFPKIRLGSERIIVPGLRERFFPQFLLTRTDLTYDMSMILSSSTSYIDLVIIFDI